MHNILWLCPGQLDARQIIPRQKDAKRRAFYVLFAAFRKAYAPIHATATLENTGVSRNVSRETIPRTRKTIPSMFLRLLTRLRLLAFAPGTAHNAACHT